MPFKKMNVKAAIDEKRKDHEFDLQYMDVQKEYDLIRQVVEARKELGMTQKNLAETVGISQQEISRFENERHIPKLSSFIKIIEALGLELRLEKKRTAH